MEEGGGVGYCEGMPALPPLPLALGTGSSPATTVTFKGILALGVATMHTTAGPSLWYTVYSGWVKLTWTTVQKRYDIAKH